MSKHVAIADDPATGRLSPKQRRFCAEYLVDLNAAAAAQRAGYAASSTRGYIYAELMQNAAVKAEIGRLTKERADRTLVSADRVVLELATIAFSDLTQYAVTDAGKLEVEPDADPLATRAVASARRKTRRLGRGDDAIQETDTEIKLWDKVAALKLLGQHLGLFGKRVTVAGDPDKPIQVEGKHQHEHRAALPADDAIAECLRRLGLPVPGDGAAVK